MLAIAAIIAFILGLAVRVILRTSFRDPWVWNFIGLSCLSLALFLGAGWPNRNRP